MFFFLFFSKGVRTKTGKPRGKLEGEKHHKTEFLLSHQFINEFKATLNCAEFIKTAGLTHKVTLPLVCLGTTLFCCSSPSLDTLQQKPKKKKKQF